MSEAVYAGHESWEFYQKPVYLSLAFFVLAVFVAVPKDRARRMLYKHGRRLRGPELVTTTLPDGVSFINEEIGWWDKTFHKNLSRWARVPRDREAMHLLMLEGGADIRFIQQMLGHASLAATELYTDVSIRMLKQVHAATHPAAHLEKKKPASQTEDDAAARAELLATLDAESEDDEES